MDRVLRWKDAVAYLGGELEAHERSLCVPGQATFALLACRAAGHALRLTNRSGEHAERRLLLSSAWTEGVAGAVREATDPRAQPVLVLVLLNRSPCADCAHQLAGALHALHDRHPVGFERHVFVLASLGYYQGRGFMCDEGAPQLSPQSRSRHVTTDRGLAELHEAGWRLCVLAPGDQPTARGEELAQALARLER